jgi:hypothetical protein
MAKKKAPKEPREKSDKEKLLIRIRERAKAMFEHDKDNRLKALDDLKFLHVPGSQWDEQQVKDRGKRPCYEFNKLRVTTKRIVNDMRANRPQGKVRGVEDGDKDTAEVMEGLIRNIWNVSDGDTVIDYAGEYQVGGGMGAWRVSCEYSDDSFTQDIKVEAIKNPFCLYADPACSDPLKRDANDWVLTERISKSSYKDRWPEAQVIDFDDVDFDDDDDWMSDADQMVRICEYWWKEPYEKEIWQLADGKVIDRTDGIDPALIVKTRNVHCHKVMMCIASGNAILTEPTEWAGKEFPFIQIYGEWIVIDGKIYWFGLTRFGKDAQRSYNISNTAIIETVAAAPQAKYWATPDQAQGHTEQWAIAHKELMPFQLYNADPKTGGAPPQRMPGAEVPVALMQQAQIASEDIKAVTGIYDASLGKQSNETSGKAITARQMQGEIATFNFSDNMAKGIRRTWEILIDLVPKVYDTARTVRTLGVDGAEKYVKINTMVQDPSTGEVKPLNDLGTGKFDVTVTVGPSFSTQRQEASQVFSEMASTFPPLMQVAGDLIFKSMDVPYSEQIAERMKTLLPPQIQQQEADGKPVPPEAQAALAQADQAMQMVQQQGQLVQQAAAEAEQGKAEAEKAKAEVQKLISQLEIKKAQFDAHVAQVEAQMTLKDAQSASGEAQKGTQENRERLGQELQEAVLQMQQDFAQAQQGMLQTLAEIMSKQAPQIVVADPPKRKVVRMKVGNKLVEGEIQEVA